MYEIIFVLALIAFVYGVIAKKVESTVISGPTIFVFLGLLLSPLALSVLDVAPNGELLSGFAEITLALVLFTDASSANLKVIKKSVGLPERLLLIGLPLTILLGIGTAHILFADFTFIEAAIVSIILAPTDAGLGKAVVSNPKVPEKIRESLNIESGLNDGICVPFLLLCLAFVDNTNGGSSIGSFFVNAIGVGAVAGAVMTYLGSLMIKYAGSKGWINESWEKVIVIALAFSIYGLAEWLGGSGFIACFVGGLLFGSLAKNHREKLVVAAEGFGDSLALITWTLFAAASLGVVILNMKVSYLLYAILSLTIARILPVFLTLFKSGIDTKGKIFMGWFGPRGTSQHCICYHDSGHQLAK